MVVRGSSGAGKPLPHQASMSTMRLAAADSPVQAPACRGGWEPQLQWVESFSAVKAAVEPQDPPWVAAATAQSMCWPANDAAKLVAHYQAH